jgi:hypothetical protein
MMRDRGESAPPPAASGVSHSNAAGDGVVCVACGAHVAHLFTAYSAGAVRLSQCAPVNGALRGCGARLADPFLERDGVLVFLDLLLLRRPAFRHVLINRPAVGAHAARAAKAAATSAASAAATSGRVARLPALWKIALSLLALDTYSTTFEALAPPRPVAPGLSLSWRWPSAPFEAPAGTHTAAAATDDPELPWLPIDPLHQHASFARVLAAAAPDPRTQRLLAERLAIGRTASHGTRRGDDGWWRRWLPAPPWAPAVSSPPPPPLAADDAPAPGCEEFVFHCSADRCTVPVVLTGERCLRYRGRAGGKSDEGVGTLQARLEQPQPDAPPLSAAVSPSFLPLLLAAPSPRLHLFVLAVFGAVAAQWGAYVAGVAAVVAALSAVATVTPPRPASSSRGQLLSTLLLASHGKLLLLLAMVWPYPRAITAAVDAYTLAAHAVALGAVGHAAPGTAAVLAVAAGVAASAAARAALAAVGALPFLPVYGSVGITAAAG